MLLKVSGSSVCVSMVEVVDEEGTVGEVSALLLEARALVVAMVGFVVGLELELDVVAPGDDTPGQSKPTRLPINTCPSTVVALTLTSLQAVWTTYCTLLRPLMHSAEQIFPLLESKSRNPQPWMRVL